LERVGSQRLNVTWAESTETLVLQFKDKIFVIERVSAGDRSGGTEMLGPLEDWVERGVAPHRIIAAHQTGTVVDRTRPLCAYPREARYIGSGSINDGANFVCRRPLDDEDRD